MGILNVFKSQHKVTDFSNIGFIVNSMKDMLELGTQTCRRGTRIEIQGKGVYYCWKLSSGAELWAQLNQKNEPIGLHPGFTGKSKLNVKAKAFYPTSGTLLDGGYHGWIITDDQEYPLLFDVPNFFQNKVINAEREIVAQITAFTKEINYFANEGERDKHELWSKWAIQSFAPSGSFNSDPNADPLPLALLSGYVKEVELRKNEFTGEAFYWLFVDSLSAGYDVVIDPQLLSTEPQVGGIVSGSFYLSGKIIE